MVSPPIGVRRRDHPHHASGGSGGVGGHRLGGGPGPPGGDGEKSWRRRDDRGAMMMPTGVAVRGFVARCRSRLGAPPSSRMLLGAFKVVATLFVLVQLSRRSLSFFRGAGAGESGQDAEYRRHLQDYERRRWLYLECKTNHTATATDAAKSVASACFDSGRELMETAVGFVRKGREIGRLDLNRQYDRLVDAEEFAAAALRTKDGNSKLSDENDNSFRRAAGDLYITMGIIERGRDSPPRGRHFFQKAMEVSPKHKGEARWHMSQLPARNLDERLGREEAEKGVRGAPGRTVLCCVAMDEEPYIDEWADFHLGIGFAKIVVYDNTEMNHLRQWGRRRGNATVEVVHYPGTVMQGWAYADCARRAVAGDFGNETTWAGFWDVDEFLVLKKHDRIDELLDEHLPNGGALGVNWLIFGPSGRTVYEPLPVTKRFVYREESPNGHVKSIARLADMNVTVEYPNPHFPSLINGAKQVDTDGETFEGAKNGREPADVALLHHYVTKSYRELVDKRLRGRADQAGHTPRNPGQAYEDRVNDAVANLKDALSLDGSVGRDVSGTRGAEHVPVSGQVPRTFDDSAWSVLKKVAPRYALYDALDG